MCGDQVSSQRVWLARLITELPDEWIAVLFPVLRRLVAVVTRFFAAAGNAAADVCLGAAGRAAVVGVGAEDRATGFPAVGAGRAGTHAVAVAVRAGRVSAQPPHAVYARDTVRHDRALPLTIPTGDARHAIGLPAGNRAGRDRRSCHAGVGGRGRAAVGRADAISNARGAGRTLWRAVVGGHVAESDGGVGRGTGAAAARDAARAGAAVAG